MCKNKALFETVAMTPAIDLFNRSYVNVVTHYLQRKGYRVDDFLNHLNLRKQNRNTSPLTLDEVIHCIRESILFTGDTGFPLKAGRRIHLTDFSDLGALFMHCPNIQVMVNDIVHFNNLVQFSGFAITTLEEGGLFHFRFHPKPRYSDSEIAPLVDLALAASANLTFFLAYEKCVADLGKAEVHMRHAPIADESVYHKIFKVPVKFNQKYNQLVFSSSFLKAPIYNANPDVYKLLRARLDRKVALLTNSMQMKDRVCALLNASHMPYSLNVRDVAQNLNVSLSSLQRKLAKEGTSFSEIQNVIVIQRAKSLLCNTTSSVLSIALDLGFSEVNSFYRSFKRWVELTPSEFRDKSKT